MDQEPVALSAKVSIRAYWNRARLTSKITSVVLGTLLVSGLVSMTLVYLLTRQLLNNQVDQRALGLAKNLADTASGYVAARNVLMLHAIVAKYNYQDNIAYAFVRGRDGNALAHSFGGQFPEELRIETSVENQNQGNRRIVTYRDRRVFESVVPILAGQLGSAHVGIWADIVAKEIHESLIPIVLVVGILFLVAGGVSLLLSRHIVKRIIRLQSIADRMSKGNLEECVGVELGDEIEELGMSLERMRTSLKAAMLKLRHIDSQGPSLARQQGDGNAKATA